MALQLCYLEFEPSTIAHRARAHAQGFRTPKCSIYLQCGRNGWQAPREGSNDQILGMRAYAKTVASLFATEAIFHHLFDAGKESCVRSSRAKNPDVCTLVSCRCMLLCRTQSCIPSPEISSAGARIVHCVGHGRAASASSTACVTDPTDAFGSRHAEHRVITPASTSADKQARLCGGRELAEGAATTRVHVRHACWYAHIGAAVMRCCFVL